METFTVKLGSITARQARRSVASRQSAATRRRWSSADRADAKQQAAKAR